MSLSRQYRPSMMARRRLVAYTLAISVSILLAYIMFAYGATDNNDPDEVGKDLPHSSNHLLSAESETVVVAGELNVDDDFEIIKGEVAMEGNGGVLPYLHCGPKYTKSNVDGPEIILLHGARFKKDDWATESVTNAKGGLMGLFCSSSTQSILGSKGLPSVTALDLSVQSKGSDLIRALEALQSDLLYSGDKPFVVSPSASGRSMVDLATVVTKATTDDERALLSKHVRGWISVAAGSVLDASDEALGAYPKYQIPVLGIHGNKDAMGKKVTERLVQLANAKGVEIEGTHPCYLDSPHTFVTELAQWIKAL